MCRNPRKLTASQAGRLPPPTGLLCLRSYRAALLLRVVKRTMSLGIYFHPVPFAPTPLSCGLPLGCRQPPVLRPVIIALWRSTWLMGVPLPSVGRW